MQRLESVYKLKLIYISALEIVLDIIFGWDTLCLIMMSIFEGFSLISLFSLYATTFCYTCIVSYSVYSMTIFRCVSQKSIKR